MPDNSIQNQASYPRPKVVSISKNTEKREPAKYNKPHGIIPLADISWMTKQVRSIQVLWGECWQTDPFGSRFMKLTTTLKASAFRLARQALSVAGLFEFKRETSIYDSRKTESWSIVNLHGARRIKEFWNSEIAATDSEIPATNSPISPTNSPISPTDLAISATNSPDICSETIANTGVPEPLSNSSLSSQELLKEVSDEEVIQELEPVEQVPTLAEKIALITKLSLSRDTSTAEKVLSVIERCMKKAKEEQPEQTFGELFITTYKWKIDDRRLQKLHQLTNELKGLFLEKFDNLFGIYRRNLPEIFDRVISLVKNDASYQPTD